MIWVCKHANTIFIVRLVGVILNTLEANGEKCRMQKRREFIKMISSMPVWSTPVILTVTLPAHAQSSLICTAEVIAGIQITVRDSMTSANISCNATATIMEGSYSETLTPLNCSAEGILEGAYERSGTYQIEITAPNLSASL